MKRAIVATLALCLAAPAGAVEPLAPVDIEEWQVPWDGRPRDPYAVSPTEVWFVDQRRHYLARLDPEAGTFTRRALDDRAGPHNLIVGSDGIVWYSGNLAGYIGRYDPAADEITRIEMPDPAARDPHTLIFDAAEDIIWFTAQGSNFVGRLATSDLSVDLMKVPTPRAQPYGITVAPDGVPWAVLLGTNKLLRIDPQSLELTEIDIPASGARPRRIVAASDGRLYYVDYARGTLGRYDPKSRTFAEWELPSGGRAGPYGMAIDGKDRVWVVETGPSPNLFVGFDTAREEVFSVTPIPSGGGAVRHMDYHAPTRTVWFGTDTGTIGRAVVGE